MRMAEPDIPKQVRKNALVLYDSKTIEKRKVISCEKETYLDNRHEEKTSLMEG